MKFNKEGLKKRMLQGLSGGLIALMIASNVACDKTTTMSVNEWLDDQKVGGVNVMDMGQDGAMEIMGHNTENPYCVEYRGLPLKTLKKLGAPIVEDEEGHLSYDSEGQERMADCMAYGDTKNNKIYLMLLRSDINQISATYTLEYDVSNKEMETFASLVGDVRMRKFIQGLDETHEAKVEQKQLYFNYSIAGELYIEDFNPDTLDMTFVMYDAEKGIVTYSCNMQELCKHGSLYGYAYEVESIFGKTKGLNWMGGKNSIRQNAKFEEVLIPSSDLVIDYNVNFTYKIKDNVESETFAK